jgi:C4-dicarboxylate-specific signal transduction histidine kinase
MSTLLVTGLALGAVVTERENSARLALQREKQLRDSEANLARASRAATTGELASTLAHELNQPMTALVSYLRASEIMMADGSRNDARLAPTLRKAADEALRAVNGDRVFIEVILSNLLANALDATEERQNAIIEIAASRSGKAIHLSVDDNGRGMSEQIRRDLFKAFVTSKTEGLGVGLAVSRSLAEACGGELRLAESSLGGAKFELVLPIDTVRRESP